MKLFVFSLFALGIAIDRQFTRCQARISQCLAVSFLTIILTARFCWVTTLLGVAGVNCSGVGDGDLHLAYQKVTDGSSWGWKVLATHQHCFINPLIFLFKNPWFTHPRWWFQGIFWPSTDTYPGDSHSLPPTINLSSLTVHHRSRNFSGEIWHLFPGITVFHITTIVRIPYQSQPRFHWFQYLEDLWTPLRT